VQLTCISVSVISLQPRLVGQVRVLPKEKRHHPVLSAQRVRLLIWHPETMEGNRTMCHLPVIWPRLHKLRNALRRWGINNCPTNSSTSQPKTRCITSRRWTCLAESIYQGWILRSWKAYHIAGWTWPFRMRTSASTSSSWTQQWGMVTGIQEETDKVHLCPRPEASLCEPETDGV